MINANWVETAIRTLDYCQTRDAFLRNTETSDELVMIWAEELAKTNQPEDVIREAAALAYRNAGGKPPADPLGAIITEIRTMAKENAGLNWRNNHVLEAGEGETTRGPVRSAYEVHDAIQVMCGNRQGKFGGWQRGCGAPAGEYCLNADGSQRRTPHHSRLHIALDRLPSERQLDEMYRQSPTFDENVNVHTNRR